MSSTSWRSTSVAKALRVSKKREWPEADQATDFEAIACSEHREDTIKGKAGAALCSWPVSVSQHSA